MELGSFFLFLQEQIKDIIIIFVFGRMRRRMVEMICLKGISKLCVQHLLHYYLVWIFRIFIVYRRNVPARVSQFIPELAFLIIIFNLL
jgi:hypothetical protein